MASDEISGEVCEEDVPDPQVMLGGEREVLIHVTLRVDHGRHVRMLVSHQVRRVREAIQIKLLHNHGSCSQEDLGYPTGALLAGVVIG